MGRAMLNICIVFAQLERETIQKRVTDAYYSRCQRGFHMSGAAPFGFPEVTPSQLIFAKLNLTFNADTVLAVYRLPSVNCIFPNVPAVF